MSHFVFSDFSLQGKKRKKSTKKTKLKKKNYRKPGAPKAIPKIQDFDVAH